MEKDIKEDWQRTKFKNRSELELWQITIAKKSTALQRLTERYRRFSILATVMIAWCPLFALSEPQIAYKPYIAVAFGLFFATCAAMDRWLYNGLTSIDCGTMTVTHVARLAAFYRKRHFQFQMILIPLALCLVGTLIYLSSHHPGFIYGIIFGLVVGATIGYFQFLNFMRDYKTLMKDN